MPLVRTIEGDVDPPEPWQIERLRKLKSAPTTEAIPLCDFDGKAFGRIECMTFEDLDNEALIATFVRWRNQYREGWLDQREVTLDSTRAWMRRALESDERLNRLFYFHDRLIGRGGMVDFCRHGYMSDGLVRGERGGGMSFIPFVNFACMGWDFENLDLHWMDSKVIDSNTTALHSTELLGYRVIRSVPLYVASDGQITETASPGSVVHNSRLCYLRVSRADFESAHRRAWQTRSL
jgi:hypothetical protein